MSWVQSKLSLSRVALAALLVTSASAATANVLVVRSTGPSASAYPAGRSLPDNGRITLREGDTLVVLDSRGTRTFRGPGNFNPNVAAQASARTVVASNGRRARIGAVRSAGIVPVSPTTIWHVDVSQGGNMCLADMSNVMLWRPDTSASATMTISGPQGRAQQVNWPAGESTLAWPSQLSIAEGAEYQLRQEGAASPTSVRFRRLPSQPEDMTSVASALIDAGCQEQLDLLVDSVAQQ